MHGVHTAQRQRQRQSGGSQAVTVQTHRIHNTGVSVQRRTCVRSGAQTDPGHNYPVPRRQTERDTQRGWWRGFQRRHNEEAGCRHHQAQGTRWRHAGVMLASCCGFC